MGFGELERTGKPHTGYPGSVGVFRDSEREWGDYTCTVDSKDSRARRREIDLGIIFIK